MVVCLRDQWRDFIFARAVFNLAIGPNRFVSNLDNASGAVLATQRGLGLVHPARNHALNGVERVGDEVGSCEMGALGRFDRPEVRDTISGPRHIQIMPTAAASAMTLPHNVPNSFHDAAPCETA